MNAEELLRHYERVADASDSIPSLRRFILELAVRGKLAPQDPNDVPASALLTEIDVKRSQLAVEGKTSKERAPLENVDGPFGLPGSWVWTRLGRLTSYIQRGKSPKYADVGGTPVVSQKCVQWTGLDLSAARMITVESLADYDEIRFLRDGDLLWNSTGTGTIGRIIRLVQPPDRLVCDSHVTVVRCLGVHPEYIRTWLRSDAVYGGIEGRAAGSTNQVELTAQMASSQAVPLPPLAEQHRIVAKVDELMALCDRLEAARAEREAARDRLIAASLARLNTPDPETFREDVRFALNTLPALAVRVTQIRQLRASILRLALRGSLVRQSPDDEPASRLLDLIHSRRHQLLESGYPNAEEARTQAKKQAEQRLPDEVALLPDGWAWATLMQCSLLVVDCKNKTAPYSSSGIRLVRTTNVRDGRLNNIDQRFVTPATYAAWSARCEPAPGDILITREAPMGEVCLIPAGEMVCLGQRMMLVRLVDDTIDPAFMLYSLRDPDLLSRVQDKPIGATVQHLRVGGIETLMIPLPPLAEQRRIVAKLDELMAICDRLEAELTSAEGHRERLLEALLHEALQPVELREETA